MTGRRRSRSVLPTAAAALAALVLSAAPAAPTEVHVGAPVAAAVFFGLDCGIEGEMHANSYPPVYSLNVVLTAGPYDVNGANASLSCTLRRDGPGGPVLTAWSVSSVPVGSGIVPAMVPAARLLTVAPGAAIESLWVCSRVSWTNLNGPQSDVGCEEAHGTEFSSDPGDNPWLHARGVLKPQDTDLDDTSP